MRRHLGPDEIARAFALEMPVALLVPRGWVRWHWVVLCGASGGRYRVSAGDGGIREQPAAELLEICRSRVAGRAFGVDGLGYVLGPDRPFARDIDLERSQVRLAASAEDWLGFARV
jgi:hypothetical protein